MTQLLLTFTHSCELSLHFKLLNDPKCHYVPYADQQHDYFVSCSNSRGKFVPFQMIFSFDHQMFGGKKSQRRDFPGRLVVRALCLCCQSMGSVPGQGDWDIPSYMAWLRRKKKTKHKMTDYSGTMALRPLSYSHGAGYANLSGFWLSRALLMWLRPTPLAPAWTETGMQINASISFPRDKDRARKRTNTWVFNSQSPRSVTGQSNVHGLLKGWGQEDQGFQGLVS